MAASINFQKLANLLGQLSERLIDLNNAVSAWQGAQGAMDASLANVNGLVKQINDAEFGVVLPQFTVPGQVDSAWMQRVLTVARDVQAQGDELKIATGGAPLIFPQSHERINTMARRG